MVNVNVRMDEVDRDLLTNFCNHIGMSISTFFNIYAKKVINEQRIPFELKYEDPFYDEANMKFLTDGIRELNSKKGIVHKTIEDLETMENA